MNALSKVCTAGLMVAGVLLASHTRDVAALEGAIACIAPGLVMVADLTVAAMLIVRGS